METSEESPSSPSEPEAQQPEPAVALEQTETKAEPPKRRWPRLRLPRLHRPSPFVFMIVLAGLINLALGGSNFYLRQLTAANVKVSSPTTIIIPVVDQNNKPPSVPAANLATLHYVSKALGIEFDYPVDWRIGGSANDKSLTLSSPPIVVSDQAYISRAELVIEISDPASNFGGFMFNDDYKVTRDSEPLTYAKPSKVQRHTTHLSFISSSDSDTSDFILVSGNLAYKKGQSLGSQDYKAINPHIDAYLNPCHIDSQLCQAFSTAPITVAQWQNEPTFAKFRTVISSMRFTE